MATATATATPTHTMALKPALSPPPGVQSNFVDPPSLMGKNNIAMAVSISLITTMYFLRCYARIFIKKQWILEDYIGFIAWSGTVAFCGVGAGVMLHNGGKHEWDITAAQAKEAAYWFNVASIVYGVVICVTKVAVLFLYRRVFSPRRWAPFDLCIVGLMTILILFYTSLTFVKIWECTPRAKIYNPKLPGHCINISEMLNVSGLFNTITDAIILLMPVNAVWNMQLPLRKKIVVVLVFTFGLCAPAFSLVGYIVRERGTDNPDKTWVQPDIVMWGIAELTTGVLCFSVPEIGPIFRNRQQNRPTQSILNGKYRSSSYGKSGNSGLSGGKPSFAKTSRTGDSESYLELSDNHNMYDVEAAKGSFPQQPSSGGVNVTQEVRVNSHTMPY